MPVLFEFPRRGHDLADVVELGRLDFEHGVRVAAGVPVEQRLGVERVHLRRAAVHVQKDDTAGRRGVVRAGAGLVGQERRQGDGAEPVGAADEHVAAGEHC